VLNTEDARRCLDAGAQFLVSPGFNRATVEFAARESKLILAGALTPTEVIEAWTAGSDLVKVFPCGQVGGAKLKALKGPLPRSRWCNGGVIEHCRGIYRSRRSRPRYRRRTCPSRSPKINNPN